MATLPSLRRLRARLHQIVRLVHDDARRAWASARQVVHFGRWQILSLCTVIALTTSICLEEFAALDSNRYVFPVLISLWLLCLLTFRLNWPPAFRDLVRPFPSPNLWLLITGAAFLLYPWSETLQTFGSFPLIIFVVMVDLLIWAALKRRFELVALPAGLGLLAFAWLWELAGRKSVVVLPVDLPGVRDAQFTPEGTAKSLLHAITNFQWREPPLAEEPTVVPQMAKGKEVLAHAFLLSELGSHPLPERSQSVLQDAPHILSDAELGGVHLEPVYHALRHLRHEPTIEAQILIGKDGSLTLGLRRSDFEPSCFSEDLPENLLKFSEDLPERLSSSNPEGGGRGVLRDLYAIVKADLAEEQETEKKGMEECNPRWADLLRKWLGVSDTPTEQDERISNVTAVGLRPEEQLTQLIDRAVLEGMNKIDPEFLGLYYEENNRSESALRYYKTALPFAIRQATEDEHASLSARMRVAYLLIAIANLEVSPRPDKEKPWENRAKAAFESAKKHYAVAVALVPEDARAHALRGRFLVLNTMALVREKAAESKVAQEDYQQAQQEFKKALNWVVGVKLRSDLGVVPTARLRAFSYRNLAYALAHKAEMLTSPPSDIELNQAKEFLTESVQEASNEYLAKGGSREVVKNCLALRREPETRLKECAAKSLGDKSPDYAEVLGVLGYIRLMRGGRDNCELSLLEFDVASDILSGLGDYERHLLVADPYVDALKTCGDADLTSLHRSIRDLLLAYENYRRGNYDESANKLGTAFTVAKGLSERLLRAGELSTSQIIVMFSATLAYDRGLVLRHWACEVREKLDDQERRAKRREAKSEVDTAIRLDRKKWEALGYRAKLVAMAPETTPAELVQVIADARKTARDKPHEADSRIALGAAELRQGDLDSALESFEEAAKLAPRDPEVHHWLGFALMQNNKDTIERAKDEWQYSKVLDPERWPLFVNPLPGCGPIMGPRRTTASPVGPGKH
jgi:tetratricopeptide (TPR) repeat protein